jgi:hypothetical protein
MKRFFRNFFREDLSLKNRWWHRLLVVVFFLSLVIITIGLIYDIYKQNDLPKYKKIGILEDRIGSQVYLIKDLVKSKEKVSNNEYYLNNSYDKNGESLLKTRTYCSNNIPNYIEEISKKTGVYYYKGNTQLIGLDSFKNYLYENEAKCVEVFTYTTGGFLGNVTGSPEYETNPIKTVLSWGIDYEDWGIYKVSIFKSIVYIFIIFLTLFIFFFAVLVFYYKVILYVIFGKSKK